MSRTQKDFAPRKEKLIQIALDQFLEKGLWKYNHHWLAKTVWGSRRAECTITSTARKKYWMQQLKRDRRWIDEVRNHYNGVTGGRQIDVSVFHRHSEQLLQSALQYGRSGDSSIVTYKLREQRMKMSGFAGDGNY